MSVELIWALWLPLGYHVRKFVKSAATTLYPLMVERSSYMPPLLFNVCICPKLWWWCCSVQPDRWKKWRLVSHFEMHFRDLAPSAVNVTCLKNWITSKNHSGVNIRPSWPRSDSRAAVGDVKAPPATLGTLWEPFGSPLGTLWEPFGNPLGTL